MARSNSILNLFKLAKEAAPIKAALPKSFGNGKSSDRIVQLGEDLSTLASIKVLMKAMEGLASVYDAKVKLKMTDEFATAAAETGRRPLNFKGVAEKAEASCELRKRSATQYLTEEEIAVMQANNMPIAEQIVQEEVPERYFFNAEIVADAKLAAKISAALASIKELQGMEVIMLQPAEPALVRQYVPEDALDVLAAKKDIETIKALLPMVSSMAIRVKMVSAELSDAINMIKATDIAL